MRSRDDTDNQREERAADHRLQREHGDLRTEHGVPHHDERPADRARNSPETAEHRPRTECPPEADLAAPFEHRHHHRVGDADASDQQCDGCKPQCEPGEGIDRGGPGLDEIRERETSTYGDSGLAAFAITSRTRSTWPFSTRTNTDSIVLAGGSDTSPRAQVSPSSTAASISVASPAGARIPITGYQAPPTPMRTPGSAMPRRSAASAPSTATGSPRAVRDPSRYGQVRKE